MTQPPEVTRSTRQLCDDILDQLSQERMLEVFEYLLDIQQMETEAADYADKLNEENGGAEK